MKRRNRLLLALPLLNTLGIACSHQDESPKVAVTQVRPDLVCNAQLSTPVAITGKGFTPVTTKALEDKQVLILPDVSLTQSQTLVGDKETSTKVVVSGTPKKPYYEALSWQNREQLTVTISDDLELTPGIYDVTVTNPDGEKRAELAHALAVVPPPELTALEPTAVCDAQNDQSVVLVGKTFLSVGDELPTVTVTASNGDVVEEFSVTAVDECEDIPNRSVDVRMCKRATIVIPAKTLPPGQYSVTLTNPAPAACATTEAILLTVNPPPEVLNVAPSTVCSGGSDLQVVGNHFQDGATVELRCGSDEPLVATDVTFIDSEHLEATFAAGIVPGDSCDVVVTNPDTCTDEPLPHQSVTGTEGPIAFYADPSVSYTDIATRLTVYLTAVTGSFEVALIDEAGNETVLSDAALVTGKNNRLQATVPSGLAAGSYAIAVRDETSCRAILPDGLTLTDQTSIALTSIDPPFAATGSSTAVTIVGNAAAFTPTPRLFLMADTPQSGDTAIQLGGVTVVDENTLTAFVPSSIKENVYDLVVVDSSGTKVGVLNRAMTITSSQPPVIDNVVPQSIAAATNQIVEIRGTYFDASTVSLRCVNGAGTTTTPPTLTWTAPNCSASNCTQTATIDGSTATAGSICVVRVTNANGSYGEFSAIGVTNSSFNLNAPVAGRGQNLQIGRRALAAAALKATRASRFVYAIGGDTGDGTAARNDIELSGVDVFGKMQSWSTARTTLNSARSLAGSSVLGRYIYVFGGTSDGSTALRSGERTQVLSPEEVPEIIDVDLCLAGGTTDCFGVAGLAEGIGEGTVSYRISALIDPNDAQNLGGETLASETLILRLPTVANRNVITQLTWTPPVDSTGQILTGITSYRVYRTVLNGTPGRDEVLLATISDPTIRQYIDDGSAPLGTETPLPAGSTSRWQALPDLTTARAGLSAAIAPDPTTANRWYVYALVGKDNAQASGGNVLASYEHLAITQNPNGKQTVATSWIAGTNPVGSARWQAGAWTVDHDSAALVPVGSTWIYVGGGALANRTDVGNVDAALVTAGGDLGTFVTTPSDFSSSRVGYGTVAAAGRLFVFGGRGPNPKSNATAAELISPLPSLAANAWNNEGLSLSTERYLPGTAIQSAFIFLIGGESASSTAQTSVDLVVW